MGIDPASDARRALLPPDSPRRASDGAPKKHGTNYRYKRGCRCAECRAVHALKERHRRIRSGVSSVRPGEAFPPAPEPLPTVEQRFWSKVDRGDGCWAWLGTPTEKGYGRLDVDGRFWMAHRYSYTLLVGPIPDGLQIDHLCRNRLCVNPAHLEPVTQRENIVRGISPAAMNASKTHCKRGHEFTPENTGVDASGGRYCRTCKRFLLRLNRRAKKISAEGSTARSGDQRGLNGCADNSTRTSTATSGELGTPHRKDAR